MNSPLMERGQTAYGPTASIDTNALKFVHWEGKEFTFEDIDYNDVSVGTKPLRSKAMVKCRIVRNMSSATLLPKRLARLKKSGLDILSRVDGYACTTADGPCYPIDEFLPAAGVRHGDLFYVVVEGPAMVLTDIASGANNLISVGDWLVSLTGATTGATTSGRVKPQDLTGATALLGNEIQHRIGRALSAQTTANTANSLLMNVTKF